MQQTTRCRRGFSRIGLYLLPLLACTAGCGSSKISGKVTYKGQPLTGGIVVFHAADGWTGSTVIRADGTYTLSKVPRGLAKIAIQNTGDETDKMPRNRKTQRRPQVEGAPSIESAPAGVKIPPKYKDAEKSGLTCDVTGGNQTHNIDLPG